MSVRQIEHVVSLSSIAWVLNVVDGIRSTSREPGLKRGVMRRVKRKSDTGQ